MSVHKPTDNKYWIINKYLMKEWMEIDCKESSYPLESSEKFF